MTVWTLLDFMTIVPNLVLHCKNFKKNESACAAVKIQEEENLQVTPKRTNIQSVIFDDEPAEIDSPPRYESNGDMFDSNYEFADIVRHSTMRVAVPSPSTRGSSYSVNSYE